MSKHRSTGNTLKQSAVVLKVMSPKCSLGKSSRAAPQSAADVVNTKVPVICDRCPWSAEEALDAAPGENQQQFAVTASPQKNSLRSPLVFFFCQHCSQLVRKPNTDEQCESSKRLSESSYIKRAAAIHKQQTHPDVTQFFTCVCTSSCVTKGTDIEMIHYCGVSQLHLVGEL